MNIYVNTSKLNNENEGPVGIATASFNNKFKVKGIKVVNGKNGLFVSMPSYVVKSAEENGANEFRDICNPTTKEFRDLLYDAVLESYHLGETKVFEIPDSDLTFDARVTPLDKEDSALIGIGSMVVNKCFAVNGIRVVERNSRTYIDMPSYKSNEVAEDGKAVYKDFCYGADHKTKSAIENSILTAYEKSMERPSIAEAITDKNEKAKDNKTTEPKTKKKELAK